MRKLRLLFIVREPYPTFRSDVATLFGKYLPRLGVSSDYVAERDADSHDAPPWGGGDAFLCEGAPSALKRHWRKARHNIRTMIHATTSVYDAIQIRDMAITSLFGMVIGRCRGLPVFFWMSFPMCDAQIQRALHGSVRSGVGFWFPLLQGLIGRWLLYGFVLRRIDHVFVQSDQMRNDLNALGVAMCKMTPVPMGVDLEVVPNRRGFEALPVRHAEEKVIVHLGVLAASRNSDILVDVLSLVRKHIPNAVLLCVGDTESAAYRAILEGKIDGLGLQGAIRITGWRSQSEAWTLARGGDIGLSLIPTDSLYAVASPTKLVECLALGLPMVVNDHPDQRDVIETSRAGYCVGWSAHELARAAVDILNDPASLAEMSASGPAYVAEHRSYSRLATLVADRYRDLLGGDSDMPRDRPSSS